MINTELSLLGGCLIVLIAILWRIQGLEAWRDRHELEHGDDDLVTMGLHRTLDSKPGEESLEP